MEAQFRIVKGQCGELIEGEPAITVATDGGDRLGRPERPGVDEGVRPIEETHSHLQPPGVGIEVMFEGMPTRGGDGDGTRPWIFFR
jgi:hypothetical protein